jgi:Na+:H+ antiporter, NhaA family
MRLAIKKFFETENLSAIIMLFAAAASILLANFSSFKVDKNFAHFVQDILMVGFFFVVGLELKKEIKEGVLAQKGAVKLPLIAAAFGMIFPAIIYSLINRNYPANFNGWAIPSATDIAFAVSVLMLVHKNISNSAKIFLLAIAIFDDLGAILIIAVFYSSALKLQFLLVCGLIVAAMAIIGRIRALAFAIIPLGGLLAYYLHLAGIHSTIAGVITAFALPLWINKSIFTSVHKLSSFIVLPLFAFVSSDVLLGDFNLITNPIALGIIFGLSVGKPIGIFCATYLAVRMKIAPLPASSWNEVLLISILAGIGFTMSLFIGMLAFSSYELQNIVKIGVVCGSCFAVGIAICLHKIKL